MGEDQVQGTLDDTFQNQLDVAKAMSDDFNLFKEYFVLTRRNGIYIITNRDTGEVMKRAKSSKVIDVWVETAIETLKRHYV